MDHRDFDRLARIVASSQSRRTLFKSLAAGAFSAIAAAAGVSGVNASAKQRSVGNSCATNADCASNLCVTESRTRKICHCAASADCPAASDQCHEASCTAGACGIAVATGRSCDDGARCTTNDVCQENGVCAGTAVSCPTPTVCQASVACDPASGNCVTVNKADGTLCGADNACSHDICQAGICAVNIPKPQGTTCDDGDVCTQTDACDGTGSCIGSNPIICTAANECYTAGACTSEAHGCQEPTYHGDGAACSAGICFNLDCCTPESIGVTCGDNYTDVLTNNCGQSVDCAPAVGIEYAPTSDSNFCFVSVKLTRFTPVTSYDVSCIAHDTGNNFHFGPFSYTTDSDGSSGPNTIFTYFNQNVSFECSTAGVSSDIVPVTCPAS